MKVWPLRCPPRVLPWLPRGVGPVWSRRPHTLGTSRHLGAVFPPILIIKRLPMFAQKSPLAKPSTIRSRVCSSSNWSMAAWKENTISFFIFPFHSEVLYMDSRLAVVAGHVGFLRCGTSGTAHPIGLVRGRNRLWAKVYFWGKASFLFSAVCILRLILRIHWTHLRVPVLWPE